jgi:hypothetical protein
MTQAQHTLPKKPKCVGRSNGTREEGKRDKTEKNEKATQGTKGPQRDTTPDNTTQPKTTRHNAT